MHHLIDNDQVAVRDKASADVAEPRLYKVIFFNDDITPIAFVIELLMRLYDHAQATALKLTMQVHNSGSAIVGTYPYDIAETKVAATTSRSRLSGFPLRCDILPETDPDA